ncbi:MULTISPECIES: hypothetical protein [unclassified Deinococcus]|uniref:hypothetical protein n=1 Tax=unclassified Deinococcus TaxID=2623546 RepID=UPI001C309894|nr:MULTISPECIES: hypothetical protein [unclassified Deinococcus]MDK2013986.1 hypothetical protein [Deinococcus sp. 43]
MDLPLPATDEPTPDEGGAPNPRLPVVLAEASLITSPVLLETQAIHHVLHCAAQRRLDQKKGSPWETLLFLLSLIVGAALLLFWNRIPLTLLLVICAVILLSALYTLRIAAQEWTRRDVDTMANLIDAARREQDLIRQLLPFSRASLLHVAATARAADNRVGIRLNLLLGANRAGGLLVLLGAFSAGKYLQDMQVTIPGLDLPITASGVIVTVLLGYGLIASLLFAGHSVNALPHYAELLKRVAALKKNLHDDRKQAGEGNA